MRSAIQSELTNSKADEASSYIDQAEDYFRAAVSAETSATRPVLFYYSFLNIAKAFITLRTNSSRSPAKHGLSEQLATGGAELTDAFLYAYRTNASSYNIYDSLKRALTGSAISTSRIRIDVSDLLPQILQGHRIWCSIQTETERFISLDRIRFLSDSKSKTMWLAIYVIADDLSRLALSRKKFLQGSGLDASFHEVTHKGKKYNRDVLKFEQKHPISYTHRPSDKIQDLVDLIKPKLWANVTSYPPYRKYYVHVAPDGGYKPTNQILAIYALIFYLGSVTRYRPHKYLEMMSGEYGAQLSEVLTNLPNQFTYLMASEFVKQDVAHAAII